MSTKLIPLMLILVASLSFMSCSKDDDEVEVKQKPTLDKSTITLFVDETSMLTYSGGNCSWSTDNYRVAEVSNGIVKAKHVGETTIHANELTCKVTVKPKYTSYKEPYMGWGSSKSIVKKYMVGYTLKGEDTTSLVYVGNGNVDAYAYLFENGTLKASALYASLINSMGLADFLLERYWVIDYEKKSSNDYEFYLGSVDLKYALIFSVTSSGCIVTYFNVESDKSPTKVELKEQCKKIMI